MVFLEVNFKWLDRVACLNPDERGNGTYSHTRGCFELAHYMRRRPMALLQRVQNWMIFDFFQLLFLSLPVPCRPCLTAVGTCNSSDLIIV